MHITAVSKALPKHCLPQDETMEALNKLWRKKDAKVPSVEYFHRAVQVRSRYFALAKAEYGSLDTFTKKNDAFIRLGTEIGAEAIAGCLEMSGLNAKDVDAIFFTTVTGLAVPTIDARLINRLGMRRDIKRTPLFGLGCLAGAAGIARMHDYLKAYPDQAAILLSVELCSLTLQAQDLSIPNIIATGLFGDGASAVCAVGSTHHLAQGRAIEVLASKSAFYYDSERVMGWDIGCDGFKIVLADSITKYVNNYLSDDLDDFLNQHRLSRQDIRSWVCHPGGPKILKAIEQSLRVEREELALTWLSLEKVGNLSSSSVLFVLADTMELRPQEAGSYGLIMAMGPGFCSEMVLFQW